MAKGATKVKNAPWTSEANAMLRGRWAIAPQRPRLLAELAALGYPLTRVIRRVGVLNLKTPFTAEDDRIIEKFYPSKMKQILLRIGDRHTSGAIRRRGQLLQQRSKGDRRIYKSHWSKEDDALLTKMWRELYRWRAIREALPGRTAEAIYHRASNKLKLTRNQRQGMLSVQEIADKAGFSWAITYRELTAAGVLILKMNRRANGKRIFWVDEGDAMEAMEAYVKTVAERTTQVAMLRELGIALYTLRRACQEALIDLPSGKRGTPTFYDSEMVGAIRSAVDAWKARKAPRAKPVDAWRRRRGRQPPACAA